MFLNRTRDVGTISFEEAERFGLLGPTARASGLVRDVRVEAPYGAYLQFPISAVTETKGDLEARCVVRLNELLVSCFAIRTILYNLPEGPLTVKIAYSDVLEVGDFVVAMADADGQDAAQDQGR